MIQNVQWTYPERRSAFPFSYALLGGDVNMPAYFIPDPIPSSILAASLLNLILSYCCHCLPIVFFCLQCALKPAVFGLLRSPLQVFRLKTYLGNRFGVGSARTMTILSERIMSGYGTKVFRNTILVSRGGGDRRTSKTWTSGAKTRIVLGKPGQWVTLSEGHLKENYDTKALEGKVNPLPRFQHMPEDNLE